MTSSSSRTFCPGVIITVRTLDEVIVSRTCEHLHLGRRAEEETRNCPRRTSAHVSDHTGGVVQIGMSSRWQQLVQSMRFRIIAAAVVLLVLASAVSLVLLRQVLFAGLNDGI